MEWNGVSEIPAIFPILAEVSGPVKPEGSVGLPEAFDL
jgi:hypothetical protein